MHQKNKTDTRYIAVFKSLFRIYAMMVFGISRWQDFIRGKNNRTHRGSQNKQEQAVKNIPEAAAENNSSKETTGTTAGSTGENTSIVKTGLFILFLIYIGGCFIALFRMITVNLYKSLQPLGMQHLLFEIEITALFVFLFISNFLLTLSTYFIGNIEQTLRAMPIPSRILFSAKFLAHCLPAMIISISFFGITAVTYGRYEYSPASFYAMALIGAVFFPLPIIGLCYLINIGVMRITKIFKQRRFVMMITGLLGIAMALGINYFVQSVNMLRDVPDLAGTLSRYRQRISALIHYLLPVHFFADSLAAGSFSAAAGSFLLFITICIAVAAAIIGLLSAVYEKTQDGFDEQTFKRLTASETKTLIHSGFKHRSVFSTLLLREIHIMNREPAYLLNGPFTIILLPLIYGIMYLTGSLHLPAGTEVFMQSSAGLVIAGVCGAFLGSATGIAATAVSRDAKNLNLIKSLPLSIKRYMQAKLAHAMLFAGIGSFIGVGGITLLFSLTPLTAIAAFIIALSLALFCNLLALMLDTAHPKLHWDTPAAAVKHNLNTIIMLCSDLLLLSITVTAATLTSMPQHCYLLCFSGIPLLASGIMAHFFWPYAERKMNEIEI
ncbi:hypothetical protein ABK01_09955 [Treponema sp. OMZ 305]|uniref:putative ABC transporter permease subunit n=1 Tax=Treponema sp. OMZ 305 TaxID=1659192 RepID=UPI0020A419DA|nr:hypothetical protein [Treponema sp. OMZ 305]UTC58551.1 hypothetical protein ABK01_09955 [Treponema sp. OMZ 305]